MSSKRSNGEGSIFQANGAWWAQVIAGISPQGRTIYKRRKCKTKSEALGALRELHRLQDSGKLTAGRVKNLGNFLSEWLSKTVKPNREPATYRLYEWIVREHIKPTLGTRPLTKVTRKDVQNLLAAKATQLVAPRGPKSKGDRDTLGFYTIRNIRTVLHSAYQDAIRDGLAAVNPAHLVEVPKKPRKGGEEKWLPPAEARKLAQAVEGAELGELMLFMLHTGTRIGEATGLRRQDLDLTACTVTIRGQLHRVKGKGLQWKAGTKTNQVRTIPLTETLAAKLTDLISSLMVEGHADKDGLVFLTPDGQRVDRKHAANKLADACRKAGVPVVSPHKLRHTAASLLLAETGDLHAVQKILGHGQVALTANLYGHSNADTLRGAIGSLDRALGLID